MELITSIFVTITMLWLAYLLFASEPSRERIARFKVPGAEMKISVVVIRSWVGKRVGLLNHSELAIGHGILLKNVTQIHTRGMLFPIDVVFLDKHLRVTGIKVGLKPQSPSLTAPCNTKHTLELGVGSLKALPAKLERLELCS